MSNKSNGVNAAQLEAKMTEDNPAKKQFHVRSANLKPRWTQGTTSPRAHRYVCTQPALARSLKHHHTPTASSPQLGPSTPRDMSCPGHPSMGGWQTEVVGNRPRGKVADKILFLINIKYHV